MKLRRFINLILRPWIEWRISRSIKRIEKEIGAVVVGLLLLTVASQYMPPDRIKCWHDADADGIPEVAVVYQFSKSEGTLIEVTRESLRLPDDSIQWENPIKKRRGK